MASPLPSLPKIDTDFELPTDLHELATMRDQLSDYLSTLERNTDAINKWLTDNKDDVIVGHHRLVRAVIINQDEKASLAELARLGDKAGFVLALQDFSAAAATAFGTDSALCAAFAKIEKGVPASILEDLPEITTSGYRVPAPIAPEQPKEESAPEPEKKKWWSNVSSWFKSDADKKEEKLLEERVEMEQRLRQWRALRTELVSLQSDRHYYVDSFMDWVGETLAPLDAAKETAKIMEQYQNPGYVIRLAREDYAAVLDDKAAGLATEALEYSALASLIDTQNISRFVDKLPSLFPATETNDSQHIKKLLLADFEADSFADIAFRHVKDRKAQLNLFQAAVKVERDLTFKKIDRPFDLFTDILDQVLQPNDPLDMSAIYTVLKKIGDRYNNDLASYITSTDTSTAAAGKGVLERVTERFADDPGSLVRALTYTLQGINADKSALQLVTTVVDFNKAVTAGSATTLETALNTIEMSGNSLGFLGLYRLCYPKASIADDIVTVANGDTKTLAKLVDRALHAGVADEWKAGKNAVYGSFDKFTDFVNSHIIPHTADFPLQTARKFIASALVERGPDDLRPLLTAPNGWLETVTRSALGEQQKLEWMAALLEPFKSDIVKTNILFEASQNAAAPSARDTLLRLEKNMTGDNIRLDDDRILVHLPRIANIWYSQDQSCIRYTVSGVGNIMMDNVEPAMAREVMALIQRRGSFETEYSGLFNPANIDKIVASSDVAKMYWHLNSGDLNPDPASLRRLQARPDFLHETNTSSGITYSTNASSIALLHRDTNGSYLMIDKYGTIEMVDGKTTLPASGPLVDIGGGSWFNPSAASMISLEDGKLSFRVESKQFDDYIERITPDEYFYSLPIPKTAEAKIRAAIAADDGIATPGGALQHLFFNLKTLGYLAYQQVPETGFSCRKYSNINKPGFIRTEDSLADSIVTGLSQAQNVISAEGVFAHKDMIDDAYYNKDKKRLYLVIGNEARQIPCDEQSAYALLEKLAADDAFKTVSYTAINPVPGRTVKKPHDVINMERTTLFAYNDAREKLLVAAGHESYPVNLDRASSHALFDKLEHDGLEGARVATFNDTWLQKLQATLDGLPYVTVPLRPSLNDKTLPYLLSKACAKKSEEQPVNLEQNFRQASAKTLNTQQNASISYPAQKRMRSNAPKP